VTRNISASRKDSSRGSILELSRQEAWGPGLPALDGWKGLTCVSSTVSLSSPLIFQDAVLQNRELWLFIKKEFGFYSKSQYRILQRKLAEDSTWPPVNRTDYAVNGKNGFYVNRAYESPEEVPKGKLKLEEQASEQHFWTRL
jgi:cation-transporting ATPase 13A3/4/5